MANRNYNYNTKYGRRKARQQAWDNYQNYTPEEKAEHQSIEAGFWIVFIIIMSLIGGCIYAVSGPEALIKWLR